MEPGPPKRLRGSADAVEANRVALQNLLRRGNTTRAALLDIVRRLRENPDVEISKSRLSDANFIGFDSIRHIEKLPMEDGSTFDWEYSDPNRLTAYLVASCDRLRSAILAAFSRTPCSQRQPWRLVVGYDEFTPGNVLRPNNDRKAMALSFSFLELGQESLWQESIWLTPIVVRHGVAAKAVGGWSAMLKLYLHRHLYGPNGIAVAGLPLEIDGEVIVIWATLANLLGDGDGLRMAYEWRGAGSLKPCIRHGNVLKLDSDLACRHPAFVEIDCNQPERFRKTTPVELYDMVDAIIVMRARVVAGTATQTRLQTLLMATGLSCTPQGLLADPIIRSQADVLHAVTYDWVHAVLQDGILPIEVGLMLEASARIGITWEHIRDHLHHDWQFPKANRSKSKALYRIFAANREGGNIKASASDMLSLYGLVRYFFETRVRGRAEVQAQLDAFLAACACVDVIMSAKRGSLSMAVASQALQTAITKHLQLHISTYGNRHIKPKHHWLYDVSEQFRRDPFVLDCFIIERLHLRAKAIANDILNTRAFERSVLSSLLLVQQNQLRSDTNQYNSLFGNIMQFPGRPDGRVSDRVVQGGRQIHAGDLVFQGNAVGAVVACCSENEGLFVVVETFVLLRTVSTHGQVFNRSGAMELWQISSVELALAWAVHLDGVVVLRM